jgi:hypothetical protein
MRNMKSCSFLYKKHSRMGKRRACANSLQQTAGPIRLTGDADRARDSGASSTRSESVNSKGKGPDDPTSGPLQSTSVSSFSGWLKAR